MSYMIIKPNERPKGYNTDTWSVRSEGSLQLLGAVGWWNPWRRYVFVPEAGIAFDAACLTELVEFLKDKTEVQKRDARERKLGS